MTESSRVPPTTPEASSPESSPVLVGQAAAIRKHEKRLCVAILTYVPIEERADLFGSVAEIRAAALLAVVAAPPGEDSGSGSAACEGEERT